MIVELLRPLGTELGRRWLAALMLVTPEDRPAMVAEIERRIAELYGANHGAPPTAGSIGLAPTKEARAKPAREIRLVSPPIERDGHTEQVETTYEVDPGKPPVKRQKRGRA